jgi:hypothetical protein
LKTTSYDLDILSAREQRRPRHLHIQQLHKHPTMRIFSLREWITGRRRTRRTGFIWERDDLIDPPLRPLPPTRPRALTNTPQTHPQLQSALIARLPPEIRILIWECVVGPEDARDVLHIEVGDGILRQNRCYQRDSIVLGFQHDCWSGMWRESYRKGSVKGRRQPDGCYYAFLPLLFTCKLM